MNRRKIKLTFMNFNLTEFLKFDKWQHLTHAQLKLNFQRMCTAQSFKKLTSSV